jgi:hypothetical protein
MAKNQVYIDLIIDDKGTTKRIAVDQDKLQKSLAKTNKSAKETDRNMRGASQMSSNATKNFSKMQQGMSGIVGVYATIAAQIFAVSAAFQFLKSASQMTNLIAGQEALGQVSGVAYKTITQGLIAATDGQLQYAEAAKAAAIGTAAGLNPTQLTKLAKAAKNVSNALGRDLTDSFTRLVKGTTKAEPELLDELGIILRLEPALKEYANSLGKSVQDLSQFEKSQAIVNNVLTQAEEKFGAIEALMDPAGASLNKFIASFDELMNSFKRGVIGIMGPVFDFLSKNTFALIGVLMAFSAPILRSILPDFKAMQLGVEESLGVQKIAHDKYQLEIKETEKAIKDLGRTEAQMRRGSINKAKSTSTAAVKGGGVALDAKKGKGASFLLGVDDSKTAKADADRILKGAQAQMDKHGKVIRGQLKGWNAKQVADLRVSYKERELIMDKAHMKEAKNLKKSELNWKVTTTKIKIAMNSLKTSMISISGKMASGMDKAMKAAGWIGMIMMAYDMAMMAKDFFFPLSDKMKAANKAAEEFLSTSETLNDELKKMAGIVTNSKLDLTYADLSKQISQATTSADALNQTINFQALDAGAEGYKDAAKGYKETFKQLTKINPEYATFNKIVQEGGKLNEKQIEQLGKLQEKYAGFSKAISVLPELMKNLNDQIRDIAGGPKEIPFLKVLGTADKATEAAKGAFNAVSAAHNADKDRWKELINLRNKAREDAKKEIWTTEKQPGPLGGFQDVEVLDKGAMAAAAAAAESAQEDIDVIAKRMKDFPDAYGKQNKILKNITQTRDKFRAITEKVLEHEKTITDKKEAYAKAETAGITFAQRKKNITRAVLLEESAVAKSKEKQLVAQTELDAALDDTTDNAKQRVDAAKEGLRIAKSEHTVLEAQQQVAGQKRDIKNEEIDKQKRLLKQKREELEITQQIVDKTLELSRISSGVDSFGMEQARDKAKATQKLKALTVSKAQGDVTRATEGIDNITMLTKPEEMQRRFKVLMDAQNALGKATQDRDIFSLRGEALMNQIKGEEELMGIRLQGMSLDPVEQKALEMKIALRQLGLNANQIEKLNVDALAESYVNMADRLEEKQALFDSIKSNLEGAFEGIITGAKSAREAFADMAKGIIQSLAKIIAKQMAAKVLNSTMFSFLKAREGGVFSDGKRVPGYATGGVAKGSQAGYPIMMHGTEAVVPLPNGKSIPVEMNREAGGVNNNNIVVNVSSDGRTSREGSSGPDMDKMGGAIARAVQEELQNQKRSGGILNPYGVA